MATQFEMPAEASEVDADFKFLPPPRELEPFVEYLFASRVSAAFARGIDAMRLPEAEAQLVFVIEQGSFFPGGAWLSSHYRATLFFQPAHLQVVPIAGSLRQAIGVSLKPAGVALITARRAPDLSTESLIPLQDLWGSEGDVLLERLIEEATPQSRLAVLTTYLTARASEVPPPSATVAYAVRLIRHAHGEISTEQLAKACGFSSRTLRSAFLAEAGVSPKHLGRIARIRRALDLLQGAGVSLRDAAASTAFSDQAHMSREFRELVGMPPARLSSQLRARPLPPLATERKLTDTGLLVLPKIVAH